MSEQNESDEDSGSNDWDSPATSSLNNEPVYTPQQIGALFLDFYKFLTKLNYKPEDLKIPPPEGWPNITPESCHHFRCDYAIEVLRHLPYLDSPMDIHFRSKLMNYTRAAPDHFIKHHQDQDQQEWWSVECEVPAARMLPIALGYESYGHDIYLNVIDGEVSEVILAAFDPNPWPLEPWLEDMKEAYRTLRIIPCPGRITMDCTDNPERQEGAGRISEDEFRAQTDFWGSDLDAQYIRQVYRDFGWPDAFRQDEAFEYLHDLLVSIAEKDKYRKWAVAAPDRDPRLYKDR